MKLFPAAVLIQKNSRGGIECVVPIDAATHSAITQAWDDLPYGHARHVSRTLDILGVVA